MENSAAEPILEHLEGGKAIESSKGWSIQIRSHEPKCFTLWCRDSLEGHLSFVLILILWSRDILGKGCWSCISLRV